MRNISLDIAPLSTHEIETEKDYTAKRIRSFNRQMPLYLLCTMTFTFGLILSLIFGATAFLTPHDFEKLDQRIFSPIPYTIVCLVSMALLYFHFNKNGMNFEKQLKSQRKFLKGLENADQEDCVHIVDWLKHPEIASYRDKVVAEGRIFIKAEVELMRDFHDTSAQRQACKQVYLSDLAKTSSSPLSPA